MDKIRSKRNGLEVDALPYTDVTVKLGNGKFAELVSGSGRAGSVQNSPGLETDTADVKSQAREKRKKAEKEPSFTASSEAAVEEL